MCMLIVQMSMLVVVVCGSVWEKVIRIMVLVVVVAVMVVVRVL